MAESEGARHGSKRNKGEPRFALRGPVSSAVAILPVATCALFAASARSGTAARIAATTYGHAQAGLRAALPAGSLAPLSVVGAEGLEPPTYAL